MRELTFLADSVLIKELHQKSVIFVTNWYFLNYGYKFESNVCNRCHDLLMISMNLSNIVI